MSGAPRALDVPLVDLDAAHAEVRDALDEAYARVVKAGAFVGGPEVEGFEDEFAAYCGTARCVGVANGTEALALVLQALGVGPGDEVVVPAFTFVATAGAVVRAGAAPVFVDVLPDEPVLDPSLVAAAVSPRAKAVVAVHLHGRLADVAAVEAAAGGVAVVEDAAQAHGSRAADGRRAGALGRAAAFSFYPSKPLGALGDAGAVTTDDPDLAAAVARLRDHGRVDHHVHGRPGTNARLDALQAAFLRVKMARLDEWNERRRAAARRYRELLDGVPGLALPPDPGHAVPALFAVRTERRDEVAAALAAEGIATGVHYPATVPSQPAFAPFAAGASFPRAEAWAATVLSLPLHPHLRPETLDRVAAAVTAVLARG